MDFVEYGKENKETIMFLHGGGLSWWNFKVQAELLCDRYHIILPILNGHGGSRKKFTSIENNADEIIDYIDKNLKKSLICICGISLGGQILLEILSKRKDVCKYAIVESANIFSISMPIGLIEWSVNLTYNLIKKQWFSRLQFKYLNIREDLYEDYYRDSCLISKENMVAFLNENIKYKEKETLKDTNVQVSILVGEKENKSIIKSAKVLNQIILNSKLYILKSYKHGELSLNHPDEYINILNELLRKNI